MFGTGSLTFDVRADFEDETFEIVSVPAQSASEAAEIVRRDPEVVSTTVLGAFDSTPQRALAF